MSTGSGGGGGTSKAVASEINVTPLIDVLLVLLIIFLVVMPIMMKMETLQVPRTINDGETSDLAALTIKVKASGDLAFNDGTSEIDMSIQGIDIAKTLRPKLETMSAATDKVVFVEFEDAVPWNDVVMTMDTVRSLASDVNHDEIRVALKLREAKADGAP